MCGLSNSRMQQRTSELGVRKAFGGTCGVLIRQILNENLVLTLLGGVVGLLFSYVAVWGMRTWLFTNSQNIGTAGDFSLSMEALFSPWVFLLAFVIISVITFVTGTFQNWHVANSNPVESIKSE